MAIHKGTQHSIESANLADLLERILDKGIVIAGDIKIKLVDIELLTLQIRLVICSVDKAREMGMDWWTNHAMFESRTTQEATAHSLDRIEERLAKLESSGATG
jgi:hypothetical protein